MGVARAHHTATLLPNGLVLVAAGYGSGGGPLNDVSSQLYDPSANTWSPPSYMAYGRFGHTATLLAGGKVLVAGGLGGTITNSAELYDPATGTWGAAAAMATARYFHTATALTSGKVLVAGGFGGTFTTVRSCMTRPPTPGVRRPPWPPRAVVTRRPC
jgi:hypothetical protein